MPVIRTVRLTLIPATPEILRAELETPAALAAALGLDVPASWPPEYYDRDAVAWVLKMLEQNRFPSDWGCYYIGETLTAEPMRLIGVGGFKGAPDATGTVEIGYGVVPEFRRRGYAREAVEAWIEWAFSDARVSHVIAHTLRHLTPSIGVLESTGFRYARDGGDANEPDAIEYDLSRDTYDRRKERPPSLPLSQ